MKAKQGRSLEELISRHLEGELAEDESLQMDRLLRKNPQARQRFGAALRQELLLGEVLPALYPASAPDTAQKTVAETVPASGVKPRQRSKRLVRRSVRLAPRQRPATAFWGAALAAAGLAAAVLVWLAAGGRFSATTAVAVLDGSPAGITIKRGAAELPAAANMELLAGDRITGTEQAAGAIAYRDGTRVSLKSACDLALLTEKDAKKIGLTAGTVVCRVTPQATGQPLQFVTPQAQVTVVGTQFTLSVTAQATRVEVAQGRVTMQRLADAASVEVAGGEYAVAAPGLPLASLPLGLAATGTGLLGAYFTDMYLKNFKFSRIDAEINFVRAPGEPPEPSMRWQDYSIRWTGQVQPLRSETYTFHVLSDDGARLWVNGQLLVDNWTDHNPIEDSGSIALTAGQKYDLKLEYYQHDFGAVTKLFWSSPGTPKQIVPQSCLYPAHVP